MTALSLLDNHVSIKSWWYATKYLEPMQFNKFVENIFNFNEN